MIKGTIGNFTGQPSESFPIDNQMLDALINQNQALLSVIGNVAGDKSILLGCELSADGTQRAEGYLFVRTADYPNGEVLYFEGGAVADNMYIKKEAVPVVAGEDSWDNAATIRSLAAGSGDESYQWSDFSEFYNSRQLSVAIAPLGSITLWAGTLNAIPANYHLCDGTKLNIADYPALYNVLRGTYNSPVDDGVFRLPDLRGKFVVGYNETDADYLKMGNVGGSKSVILGAGQIPAHSHDVLYETSPAQAYTTGAGLPVPILGTGVQRVVTEDNTPANRSHENRPPYFTLAYIIRLS